MSKKVPHNKQKEDPVSQVKNETDSKELSNTVLLILTVSLAIIYFVFSTLSDGFYQHDEVGNFMAAQRIWYDDIIQILGANTKSGYRLLYALPALGGFAFLKLFNSLVAAFTVYFSYKLLAKLGSKNKLLIFFVLGLQPLWFMLSFRNYAELTVAFLLVMTALQFFNKNYIIAALIVSYVAFTRQEYHIISGLLFLVFAFKKEWIAALLTGTFTVLQNLIGFIITGDILYLPNSVMVYSKKIEGIWPKQGFDHYLTMSNVIFGSVAITLFFAYVGIIILKKKKPNWYLLVPVVFIFFLNCAFQAESFKIGPGNGGNLRYLITMAPLLAILGVLAIDEIIDFQKKHLLLIFLIPVALLVYMFQSYAHLNYGLHLSDGLNNTEEIENWKPLVLTVILTALLVIPLKKKQYLIGIAALSIMVGVTSIATRKIQPEERAVKKAAKWYENHIKLNQNPQTAQNQLYSDTNRVACGHALFYYYLGKNKYDFVKPSIMTYLDQETIDTLGRGDLVVWDSHYGDRREVATSQPYQYYESSPNYQKIQYYQSTDNRFTIVFFKKMVTK
jgi:hypothetical protein